MVEVRLIKTDYRQLPLHYAVIVGKYEGKWVLCQHKKRTTWEVPGGHIEEGKHRRRLRAGSFMRRAERRSFSCILSEPMGSNKNGKPAVWWRRILGCSTLPRYFPSSRCLKILR